MDDTMLSALRETRLITLAARMMKSNEVSQRYGLSLGEAQVQALIAAEADYPARMRAAGVRRGNPAAPDVYFLRFPVYDT